jgi:chromosome segregation ATPase
MSDVVTEKFTQKVANMLEEMSEINILIRRLDSTKETLNKINERNDAIHGAIVHIEKSLKLDDKRLMALEAQTKSLEAQTAALKTGLEAQYQQTELLRETLAQQRRQSEQFEQAARALNQIVQSQELSIKGHTEKIREELKGRVGDANRLVGWLIGANILLILVVAIFVYEVNKFYAPH